MKRIFLFLLTNIAVMLVLSIVASLLGVDRFLTANGLNLGALLAFSAIFGFGGSFISLQMSKWMAKRSTGAHVITEPRNSAEMWLLNTVERQARAAGIAMPEVAVYDAPEPNAFATGPSKNNSLVAVSTGLMRSMSQDEIEAVLAHEVSHVANGDMVTLTLIQGVVNTFVIFMARVVGYIIDQAVFRRGSDDRGPGFVGILLSARTDIVADGAVPGKGAALEEEDERDRQLQHEAEVLAVFQGPRVVPVGEGEARLQTGEARGAALQHAAQQGPLAHPVGIHVVEDRQGGKPRPRPSSAFAFSAVFPVPNKS